MLLSQNGCQIRFVGQISKENVSASTVVRRVVAEAIDERRTRLNNTSRSEFIAMILEWWYAKGCPAVSEADKFLMLAVAESQAKYGANK